MLKQKQEVTL